MRIDDLCKLLYISVSFGAGDELMFEPLLLETLAHFTKLMKVYQSEEEEDLYV